MTQILSLSVQNILGAESIEFRPDGQSVTIGGANGEGKSSAIWALVMALGGKGQIPEKPVHDGEEFGVVAIELDKFQVHLEITKDRKQKLIVTSADGAKYQSPQALLDKLFGGLSFDPGGFMAMEPAKRFETLRNLVGLDLNDLKAEYEKVYTERRDVGRDVKTLEGKISGQNFYDDAPEAEIDVAASLSEMRECEGRLQISVDKKKDIEQMAVKISDYQQAVKGARDRIVELQQQIKELEAGIIVAEDNITKMEIQRNDFIKEMNEKADTADIKRIAEINSIISNASEANKKFQHNASVKALQSELGTLNTAQAERDKKLDDLQAKKIERLNAAKFPIEGLSLDGEVVTYNSIPFDQLSESEQWEVSTAIGFALNPKGIVFMKNCGGLDRKSRDRVRARAAASGVQLFLEVVDDAEDVQIVIAEGKVLENRL